MKNGKERVIHCMFSPNNMPIPFPLDVSVIGCYICFKEIKECGEGRAQYSYL